MSTKYTMSGGDWLLSPNGQYSAVMQGDGNFVLYWGRYPDRLVGPMWATDTGNTCRAASCPASTSTAPATTTGTADAIVLGFRYPPPGTGPDTERGTHRGPRRQRR